MRRQAESFLGEGRGGPFWDRWLREYYMVRIEVRVHVERITVWPDLRCEGPPEPYGARARRGRPTRNGAAQGHGAARGRGARRQAAREDAPPAARLRRRRTAIPRSARWSWTASDATGLELRAPAGVPPGARRAGLLGHDYRPKLIGLTARQYTGWLEAGEDRALYAPHSETGFVAPPNKTLLLLGNGLQAKLGVRKARREGTAGVRAGGGRARRIRRRSGAHTRRGLAVSGARAAATCARRARWRCTSSPPPIPSAARPAAITLGRARSRLYSPSTSGHSCSSTSSPAASGVDGQLVRPRSARANATCTRRGLGIGPRKSFSVPVIAVGHQRRARLERQPARRRAWGGPAPPGRGCACPRGTAPAGRPARRITRAVSSASASDAAAPHREGPEAHQQPPVARLDQLGLGHEAQVPARADAR